MWEKADEVEVFGGGARRLDDTPGVYIQEIVGINDQEKARSGQIYCKTRKKVLAVLDPAKDGQVSEFGEHAGGANPVGSEPSEALFDHGLTFHVRQLKELLGAALYLAPWEAEAAGVAPGAMFKDLPVKQQGKQKIHEIIDEGSAEGRLVKVRVYWKTVKSNTAKRALMKTGMPEAEADEKSFVAKIMINYAPHGLNKADFDSLRS